MRVADFVADRLSFLGIDTCFVVTGGGAMHLNDAIGACSRMRKVYCHHEQAAAMAAEAYARVAAKPALVNVTTGPGGINALNGVFGAYTDSIAMVVVSGQVKRETLLRFNPIPGLRQLGDQEVDILTMVQPITKWAHLLSSAEEIADTINEAFVKATRGRPGPVWIDLPVDLQGAQISDDVAAKVTAPLRETDASPKLDPRQVVAVLKTLASAKRPVILAGSGVRIAGAEDELLKLAELIQVPVTTAWTHDIFPNDHPLFAGRPGTIGTRAGNFVVQNADVVLVLGSRLNIRQISYNWGSFARHAKKIWVDIDASELRKPFVKSDLEVIADVRDFMSALAGAAYAEPSKSRHHAWLSWCAEVNRKYSPKDADYPLSANAINPYHFVRELFDNLQSSDIVACGDATATIVPFQVGKLKRGMRMLSNSGCASMGYDIPAALGAAVAKPESRVVCLAGDGSCMLNIQELQTIKALGLNVLVFVLNNDGYLSIKQTQRNFFGREAGCSSTSGLTFPDFKKLGEAFGLASCNLERHGWELNLRRILETKGPLLCEVSLDTGQEFEPRLRSRIVDGVIHTPELEDMYPFLDPQEIQSVRDSALALR